MSPTLKALGIDQLSVAQRRASSGGIGEGTNNALDRAGITVFRDITFVAAGPANERCRSAA